MSKLIKILFIFVLFALGGSVHGNAQGPLPQCLVFDRGAELINIRMTEDSIRTSISIMRKGYETEEQRKKAREEYHRQGDPYQPPPSFTINFSSDSKPETIETIEELHCISLEEFRETDGRGAGPMRFFFQKNPDGTFLMWDNMLLWAVE